MPTRSEELVLRYKYRKALEMVKNLKKREFSAEFYESLTEAVSRVFSLIPPGSKVGLGGSVTTRESGIVSMLEERGDTIYDHWAVSTKEEIDCRRRKQQSCDVFLTGTNAITLKGQLVNLDGTGNRVSAMAFGPQRVIVMAGMNKITDDLEEAFWRVKNYAAPINYSRMAPQPPTTCSEKGFCVDCLPPVRQCRVWSILEGKPKGIESYNIIIIGEDLGF